MTRTEQIHEIFTTRGTDKSSHGYASVYAAIPENITSVLEIGITESSLLSWTDIFPRAYIYGIDRERKTCDHRRVQMLEIDINDLINTRNFPHFDLIVDDGSHDSYDQLAGWFKLNHLLRGTYVIEDLGRQGAENLRNTLGRFNPEIVNCREDEDGSRCLIIARKA